MPDVRLMPVFGINNTAEDAALYQQGEASRLYVRKAANVDVSPAGKVTSRAAVIQRSGEGYKNLWQSPLHGDVFASKDGKWLKMGMWEAPDVELADIGSGRVDHIVLNNLVCASTPNGLMTFNGSDAQRLTIDTPAKPLLMQSSGGSLLAGQYGVAVSWIRGGTESAVSDLATIQALDSSSMDVVFPFCMDESVTTVRLYITRTDGGELLQHSEHPISTPQVTISALGKLGQAAKFRHLSPMPAGSHLCYWQGRIITASANVLRFSEAMAYHLHDERHGFIQMPQRITFIQPVGGGLWVGQVDHVAYLQGATPSEINIQRKQSQPPVPDSATIVDSEVVGGEMSAGGGQCAVWLARNGYVAGNPQGQLVELHSGILSKIHANYGSTALVGRRLYTSAT